MNAKYRRRCSPRVWERIENLDDFATPLHRILQAIFEKREKPPLGAPPAYMVATSPTVRGLTQVDTLVIGAIYEEAISTTTVLLSLRQLPPGSVNII